MQDKNDPEKLSEKESLQANEKVASSEGEQSSLASDAPANGTDKAQASSTPSGLPFNSLLRNFAVPVALLIVSIIVWVLALASAPILDEQYLLRWLKDCRSLTGSSGIQGFMSWEGFAKQDSWGLVSHSFLLALSTLFGSSPFFFKLTGLLLHVSNSIFLFFCCRKISGTDWFFPTFTAALFVAYPLAYESAVWVPGIPLALAGLGFTSAFYLYLAGREKGLNWPYTASISLLTLLSIASSRSMWPAALAFGVFELFNWLLPAVRGEKKPADPTMKMITCLLPLVIVGAYCAATGGGMSAFFPDLRWQNLRLEFSSLFFPINQLNWHKYSAEYRFLYITYALMAIPALLGLSLSRQARRNSLLCFVLFLVFALPFAGVAISDPTLYGERFLYLASIGLCLFLGSLLSASTQLLGRWKLGGAMAGTAVALMLLFTFGRHCWNEAASYRNSARALKAIQKSMKILAEKNAIPLLLVRDLPDRLSLVPQLSVRGPVAFDWASGLLRSNPVPDGRLKDILRKKEMRDAALRWEPNLSSFLPLIIPDEKQTWTELSPETITERLEPKLMFYKNLHLSDDKKEILLESNSENGPMFTFTVADMDNLEHDFLYVDAQIDAPTSYASPRVELHYLTNLHENFERAERFSYADAIINDGKVHRYKLSLRSNGWTTGGRIKSAAIGFPAGARVRLVKIGVIEREPEIAQLQISTNAKLADPAQKRFTPPYFNYPNDAQLGLAPLADDADAIKADFAVNHIKDAAGILAELSWPNKSFDDANSNHGSGVCYKTFRQSGNKGELSIPLRGLPGPGVYSLRVIGSAESGAYLGQFSDPICFQVPKVPQEN